MKNLTNKKQLIGLQLVNKFRAFYVTRSYITAFTRARHLYTFSQFNQVHNPTFHFLKNPP
jgi:hypothetical protein